ncbi:MAG: DUF2442 domain-containing protein [Bacteroidota bacterium]
MQRNKMLDKISDETTAVEETIEIIRAEYLKCYRIKLPFADGKEQLVDFEEFLRSSFHFDIPKYLDIEKFKSFKIVNGNLDWNDYELCFPVADLYEGLI